MGHNFYVIMTMSPGTSRSPPLTRTFKTREEANHIMLNLINVNCIADTISISCRMLTGIGPLHSGTGQPNPNSNLKDITTHDKGNSAFYKGNNTSSKEWIKVEVITAAEKKDRDFENNRNRHTSRKDLELSRLTTTFDSDDKFDLEAAIEQDLHKTPTEETGWEIDGHINMRGDKYPAGRSMDSDINKILKSRNRRNSVLEMCSSPPTENLPSLGGNSMAQKKRSRRGTSDSYVNSKKRPQFGGTEQN